MDKEEIFNIDRKGQSSKAQLKPVQWSWDSEDLTIRVVINF